MTREIKEVFKTPTFYIAIAVFFFLCGLKFYNALTMYAEYSQNYMQLPYGSDPVAMGLGGDIYEVALSPFYSFIATLLIIFVPVVSCLPGSDRIDNFDKFDLLGVGRYTETSYFLKKIFSSTIIFMLILIPVVLFPLVLYFFINPDINNILTTYIALVSVTILSASMSLPLGMLKFSVPVTIFVNICIQIPLYMYFFEYKFVPCFTGVVRLDCLLWTLSVLFISLFLSKKIYKTLRLFR